MKILAVIITYNPIVNDVILNIEAFIDNVSYLVIWENTISDDLKSNILKRVWQDKVVFAGEGKNKGIAYALNHICENFFFMDNTLTHLLTMDQDSTWVNFDIYTSIIQKFPDEVIFSPNVNFELPVTDYVTIVKSCITSGAVFTKSILRKIGSFNEVYSVDCVDYAFSFEAKKNKIDIVKINSAILQQSYGVSVSSKFLHFNIQNNSYSAHRLYFLARNCMLLWRDYPDFIDNDFRKTILRSYIFGKMVKILLLEENKFSKVFSILNGFFAGLFNSRKKAY